MANPDHIEILKQGVDIWNAWLREHPDVQIDFVDAYLEDAMLTGINFQGANLTNANLRNVKLSEANLRKADLAGASFVEANLIDTDLRGANLQGTNLQGANLTSADLSEARLEEVDLEWATLVGTNFNGASLVNCWIFAASVWDVNLEDATQENLIITEFHEPGITVDSIEVAQFIYLLLKNKKIRQVIDTIISKVVLILGRFSPERKMVLDAVRNELHKHNYSPIIFDFEKPVSRDFTETIRTLAHLSKFIIADLTDPSSIPQELQSIVPDLAVPVQPILAESKREYAMFIDFRKYHWVLPTYVYKDQATLLASLKAEIVDQAEVKVEEIALEKARIPESWKKRK